MTPQNAQTAAIIVQARMTSSRLPGKVLMDLNGKPVLQRVIERLTQAEAHVCVATTTNVDDDPIIALCDELGVQTFRGSENDVLSRYALAAQDLPVTEVVRVTSDCPLIDSALITVGLMQARQLPSDSYYYVSNTQDRTYPRGFDFEVFSKAQLMHANSLPLSTRQREHVTPCFYDGTITCETLQVTGDTDYSDLRLTLDTPEDFELLSTLYREHNLDQEGWFQITETMLQRPELAAVNRHIRQKEVLPDDTSQHQTVDC